LEAAGVSFPQFGHVTGGHGSAARAAALFVLLMSVISCKAHTLHRLRAFAPKHVHDAS
jgi:hypothetical protein